MNKTLVFIILSLLLFSSCYKDVEIFDDQHFKPQIQVISYLYADSVPAVIASKTDIPGQLDTSDFISDAAVKITDNQDFNQTLNLDTLFYSFVLPAIPYYIGSQPLQANHSYTIQVSYNGETAKGQTTIPNYPQYQILNQNLSCSSQIDTFFYQYLSDTLIRDTFKIVKRLSINGSIKLNFENSGPDDDYYIIFFFAKTYFNRVIADYQNFISYTTIDSGLITLDFSNIPSSNSPNEYFFIDFLPYNLQKLLLKGQEIFHPTALVFTDKNTSSNFDLNISFTILNQDDSYYTNYTNTLFTSSDTTKINMVILKISKEIYNLITSYQAYEETGGIYNPFMEPVNIYSNIDNGQGIVGGIAASKQIFTIFAQ